MEKIYILTCWFSMNYKDVIISEAKELGWINEVFSQRLLWIQSQILGRLNPWFFYVKIIRSMIFSIVITPKKEEIFLRKKGESSFTSFRMTNNHSIKFNSLAFKLQVIEFWDYHTLHPKRYQNLEAFSLFYWWLRQAQPPPCFLAMWIKLFSNF